MKSSPFFYSKKLAIAISLCSAGAVATQVFAAEEKVEEVVVPE